MPIVGSLSVIKGWVCIYTYDGRWLTLQSGENPHTATGVGTKLSYNHPIVTGISPTPTPAPTPTPTPTPSPSPSPDLGELIAYWEARGYTEATGLYVLVNKTGSYDLKNRPDRVEWFLQQAGYLPSPTPAPTPTPTPSPTPAAFEQYVMDIQAPVNPTLPSFIVKRLTSVLSKGGWELVSIEKSDEGYHLNLNKVGSVSVAAAAGIIIAILILFGVVAWTITRVSDNKKETATAKSKQEYAQIVTDYSIATGEDLTEVINDINAAFPEEAPVSNDGIMKGLSGIFENLPLLIGGIMVITLVQTLKK